MQHHPLNDFPMGTKNHYGFNVCDPLYNSFTNEERCQKEFGNFMGTAMLARIIQYMSARYDQNIVELDFDNRPPSKASKEEIDDFCEYCLAEGSSKKSAFNGMFTLIVYYS